LGKTYAHIDEGLARIIREQHVFFVATAPLDPEGHLNLSPKGLDSLRILGPKRIAYLDFVGSGVETIAHLKENHRIVLMFCRFEGSPNILRLHGRGRAVEPHQPEFAALSAHFPVHENARAIIVIEVTRISDSCGYAVPIMKFERDRNQLFAWSQKKGLEGLKTYKQEKSRRSIDGLPGLAE